MGLAMNVIEDDDDEYVSNLAFIFVYYVKNDSKTPTSAGHLPTKLFHIKNGSF